VWYFSVWIGTVPTMWYFSVSLVITCDVLYGQMRIRGRVINRIFVIVCSFWNFR
jgi:hypothetical protein